jgi:hypothetical protein
MTWPTNIVLMLKLCEEKTLFYGRELAHANRMVIPLSVRCCPAAVVWFDLYGTEIHVVCVLSPPSPSLNCWLLLDKIASSPRLHLVWLCLIVPAYLPPTRPLRIVFVSPHDGQPNHFPRRGLLLRWLICYLLRLLRSLLFNATDFTPQMSHIHRLRTSIIDHKLSLSLSLTTSKAASVHTWWI